MNGKNIEWDAGVIEKISEKDARKIIDDAGEYASWEHEGNPFCSSVDQKKVNGIIDRVRCESGLRLPTCDEMLVKYVQEKDYLAGMKGIASVDDALDTMGNGLYAPVTEAIASVILDGKKIYRSYDFGESFGVKRTEEERRELIDDVMEQARRGKMRRAPAVEFGGNPSFEGVETSWGSDDDGIPEWSNVYFESKNPPIDAINIPSTYFVNNFYMGGEAGIEFKMKAGAMIPVTLHYEKEPTNAVDSHGSRVRGEMITDPVVKDKMVEF